MKHILVSLILLGAVAALGATAVQQIVITDAGRALVDDANAAEQRATLELGTIATQDADDVAITGGSISGISALAVGDGGTGASTAGNARSNLGTLETIWCTSSQISPGDGWGTLYFAKPDQGPGATINAYRLVFPFACTIKNVAFTHTVAGIAGSDEDLEVYLRKNNSSDTPIASAYELDTLKDYVRVYDVDIAIAAGDDVVFKVVFPSAWATNPTSVTFHGMIDFAR